MSVLEYFVERDLKILEQLQEDLEGTLLCVAYGSGTAGGRRFLVQRRRELRKTYRPLLKLFHGGDIGRATDELLEAYHKFEDLARNKSLSSQQIIDEATDILYSHVVYPFPESFQEEFDRIDQ